MPFVVLLRNATANVPPASDLSSGLIATTSILPAWPSGMCGVMLPLSNPLALTDNGFIEGVGVVDGEGLVDVGPGAVNVPTGVSTPPDEPLPQAATKPAKAMHPTNVRIRSTTSPQ
jgi:hypothetical protein